MEHAGIFGGGVPGFLAQGDELYILRDLAAQDMEGFRTPKAMFSEVAAMASTGRPHRLDMETLKASSLDMFVSHTRKDPRKGRSGETHPHSRGCSRFRWKRQDCR